MKNLSHEVLVIDGVKRPYCNKLIFLFHLILFFLIGCMISYQIH